MLTNIKITARRLFEISATYVIQIIIKCFFLKVVNSNVVLDVLYYEADRKKNLPQV